MVLDFNMPMASLPSWMTDAGFTYTRNTTKRVPQNGALVELPANQFGTSYDPVTGLYGFVPEPAATNLIPYSEGAAANWTLTETTQAASSFFGFDNAIEFGDNSVQRSAYQTVTVASQAYTISIFIKMDDGLAPVYGGTTSTGDFSLLLTGGLASSAPLVVDMGGGVYRVSAQRTPGAGAANIIIRKYTTQSARTFKVAGFQIETGLRATSYIKTAGASAARSADILTIPLANIAGFNSARFALFADYRNDVSNSIAGRIITVDDASSSNRAAITRSVTPQSQVLVTSGGVQQTNQNKTTFGLSRVKAAASFELNDVRVSFDGNSQSDLTATMPVGVTQLCIGHNANAAQFNSYIYRVALITKNLTPAQLSALTA